VSDFHQIQQLAYAYARAADRRDYAAFDQVFTVDATLELPEAEIIGREAIKQAMVQLEQFKRTLHLMHNVMIDVTGDEARAEVYATAVHILDGPGGEEKLEWGIRYLDQLVNSEGGWRIRRRQLVREWQQQSAL
jgi:uncharacterized protein (TIGR02246 family)